MALPASDVRNAINLADESELSDDVVEIAIFRAVTYISELVTRSACSEDIVALTKLNYAAYLAYQSYSDRIVEELPGSHDAQGLWQPIGNPIGKQVLEKLRALKQTSDELIDLILNTPLASDPGETPEPTDAAEYPDELKLSNLSLKW